MSIKINNFSIAISARFALVTGGIIAIYSTVNHLIDADKFNCLDIDAQNKRLMINK